MGPDSKETFHFRTRTATASGDVILSERLRYPRSYRGRIKIVNGRTSPNGPREAPDPYLKPASRLVYSKEAYTESVRECQTSRTRQANRFWHG